MSDNSPATSSHCPRPYSLRINGLSLGITVKIGGGKSIVFSPAPLISLCPAAIVHQHRVNRAETSDGQPGRTRRTTTARQKSCHNSGFIGVGSKAQELYFPDSLPATKEPILLNKLYLFLILQALA